MATTPDDALEAYSNGAAGALEAFAAQLRSTASTAFIAHEEEKAKWFREAAEHCADAAARHRSLQQERVKERIERARADGCTR